MARRRLWMLNGIMIIILGINFTLWIPNVSADPSCASNQLGGTIFVDTDIDGDRDAGEPDVDPNAGIQIFAYDPAGGLLGSDTNGAGSGSGDWQIDVGAFAGTIRIEFDLPAAIAEIASARFTTNGLGSGTTVAFVSNGDCNIDLGLQVVDTGTIGTQSLSPYTSCEADTTNLITSCFILARGQFTTVGTDAVVSFGYTSGAAHNADRPFPDAGGVANQAAYDAGGHVAEGFANNLGGVTAVGAIYGLSYHRGADWIFASSYLKRHSDFGDGGPGAIYRIDRRFANDDPQRYQVFATIPNAGGNPHAGNTTLDDWLRDTATFSQISRSSLGDMDLDATEENLWVMNLNDRALYQVNIGNALPTAGAISRFPTDGLANGAGAPCAGQPNSDIVPFAVKVQLGQVYVGITCTAQSLGGTVFDNRDAMHFLVYRLDPAIGNFNLVLGVPLIDPSYAPNSADRLRVNNSWRRWNNNFYTDGDAECNGGDPANLYAGFCFNPQPLLADLEFTEDNDIILGFRDRWGDMMGSRSFNPLNPADTFTYDGIGFGDVMKACFAGPDVIFTSNGDFTLENDGTCGANTTAGSGFNDLGPGGGSFYYEDYWFSPTDTITNISLGGLAVVPGFDDVVSTVQDPIGNSGATRDGGAIWLNNDTGERSRAFRLFDTNPPGTTPDEQIATFGKSNGLGDIEFNCLLNLEIGNRVWIDTNPDGVQDPDEPPVPNATVNLYEDVNGDGIAQPDEFRGTTLTDGNGQFLFNETNVVHSEGASTIYTGLKPYTNYLAIMNNPADFGVGGPLEDYFPTIPDAVTIAQRANMRDNDGIPNAALGNLQFAQINFQTEAIGQNNHTYDFGFVNTLPPTPTPISTTQVLTPPPVNTASPNGLIITKTGTPQLAFPGDTVTWTIQITNPNNTPYANYSFVDPIDTRLSIQSVNSSFGTSNIDFGQNSVSYTGTIPANSTERVIIVTVIDPNIVPPYIIDNVVYNSNAVGVSEGESIAATARVQNFPTRLPNTGESPFWYSIIITTSLSILVLIGIGWQRIFRKRKLH